jgi:hypothetical protein
MHAHFKVIDFSILFFPDACMHAYMRANQQFFNLPVKESVFAQGKLYLKFSQITIDL